MAKRTIKKRDNWMRPTTPESINFLDHYKDKEILKSVKYQITQDYKQSRDQRQSFKDTWTEIYLLYNAYSQFYQNKPSWMSKYFVNIAFKTIETLMPPIMSALFDTPPLWTVLPTSDDTREIAHTVEMRMEQIKRNSGMYAELYTIFKETLMYGTSFGKVKYDQTPEYVGPCVKAVDLFNIFADIRAGSDIQAMRYLIERNLLHIQDIYQMQEDEIAQGVDEISDENNSVGTHMKNFSQLDRLSLMGKTTAANNSDGRLNLYHEVMESWFKWQDPNTKEWFDCVGVLVDREHLIRWEESPHKIHVNNGDWYFALKPYSIFRNSVNNHETYGKGVIEPIISGCHQVNDMRNAFMDAVMAMLMPVQELNTSVLKNANTPIGFGPGAVIEKIGPERALLSPDKDLSFINITGAVDEIKDELKDDTGLYDPFVGAEGNIRKTATETIFLGERAASRPKLSLQLNSETSLMRLGRMLYMFDREYTSEKVMVEVFDGKTIKEWKSINPSKVANLSDVTIVTAALFGFKEIVAEKMIKLMEIVSEIPAIAKMVDYEHMVKEIAAAFGQDSSKIFLDEAERKKKQEEMAAAMQAAQPAPAPMPQGMPPEMMGAGAGMPIEVPLPQANPVGAEIDAIAALEAQNQATGITPEIAELIAQGIIQ